MRNSVAARLLVVAALVGLAGLYLERASGAEPTPTREPLAGCPMTISDWSGVQAADLDDRTLGVLGVDEYVNRVYREAGSQRPVVLYVGYYASQREGDTMHSPLNCLPGAGWSPVNFRRLAIDVSPKPALESGRPVEASAVQSITVNRYVIEKGLDRQLVLYWYQGHGRVVASEYWGKIYMVLDAIRTNRTDGALVRIVAPIGASEAEAEQRAVAFAQQLYPLLGRYLPS
jgi:EpsI family protein